MRLTSRQKILWKLVNKHYRDNQFDASHGIDHVERDLKWCEILIKDELEANSEILIPACMCHDMALPFVSDDEHARKAIDYAREVLIEAGYSNNEVAKIDRAMRQHSFDDKTTDKRTIEGDILYDADKLDSTGPIGVWRILYETEIKKFPSIKECIENYLEILENLPKYSTGKYNGFYTRHGSKLAKQRLPYTISTLKEILKDIQD